MTKSTLDTYFQNTRRYALLKPYQEVELGQKICKWQQLEQLGQNTIQLSSLEIEQITKEGKIALNSLVSSNLKLVISVARKYLGYGLELSDLIQDGNLGLIRAALKYDPTKNVKFCTYAYGWIRSTIKRAVANKSRSIRLPLHVNDKLMKIKKTHQLLNQRLKRTPNVEEVAQELDIPVKEVIKYQRISQKVLALEVPIDDQDKETFLSMIPDVRDKNNPLNVVMYQEIIGFLNQLDERKRNIIILRIFEEQSLTEIGAIYNISGERVRQLYNQAIALLKKQVRINEGIAS